MSTAAIRTEIRKFIDEADDRFVKMVYAMMKVSREETLFTKSEQKELSKRIQRHKKGESKSYSWKEARTIIERVK